MISNEEWNLLMIFYSKENYFYELIILIKYLYLLQNKNCSRV